MEIIDLYDKNKKKLGKIFVRGQDELLEDECYLLEQAWIINSKNEILLTKRNEEKSHGGKWESTAGHVKSGESDIEAIQREIKEELGLDIKKSDFTFIKSLVHKHTILDIWVIKKDITLEELNLKEDEVSDAKYVSIDTFKKMLENDEAIKKLEYFIEIFETL
jgi:mutator protein MutT